MGQYLLLWTFTHIYPGNGYRPAEDAALGLRALLFWLYPVAATGLAVSPAHPLPQTFLRPWPTRIHKDQMKNSWGLHLSLSLPPSE